MEKLNIYFRGVCDIFSVKQGLPYQIWDGNTADGGTSFLATRLIHNKPILISTDLLKCYFLPLDPYFISQLTSIIILIIILLGLIFCSFRSRFLYLPFLVIPCFFIFHGHVIIDIVIRLYQYYLYFLSAVIFIFFLKKITKKILIVLKIK